MTQRVKMAPQMAAFVASSAVVFIRDAPIAIFDYDIQFFWECDLLISIFVDSDFLSKNYNWQHMQISTKTFLHKVYY